MSRALEEGEMLICVYKFTASAGAVATAFGFVGVSNMRITLSVGSNNHDGERDLTFTAGSNTFTASACTANGNTSANTNCVPYFIATLKDMKITSAMLSAWVAPT